MSLDWARQLNRGLLLFGLLAVFGAAAEDNPQAIVESTLEDVRNAIETRNEEFRDDEALLFSEVERLFLPTFDVGYSAKLVLGRAGRDATPEQRTRFAKALYKALIKKYAGYLLDYTDVNVEFLPFRGDSAAKRVRVRSRFILEDGQKAPVDYLLHRTKEGKWKAYDVSVEGISYVTNYRNQFSREIAAEGLESVIERLESIKSAADAEALDVEE